MFRTVPSFFYAPRYSGVLERMNDARPYIARDASRRSGEVHGGGHLLSGREVNKIGGSYGNGRGM